MLRQTFPSTSGKTAHPVALASNSARSSFMPRARSNAPIQAGILRLLVLGLVKARRLMARVTKVVLSLDAPHIVSFRSI